ncbi:MAG: T9SS type A sorting domain-containing protein [Candidatus Eisenbacteria bacterium]|nr:T9SS type A sorting domain-containing protein [Candidatus Latescibacterota bacterium]MBD3303334.1 T9SS type A sorting domain-containing protein [Candidatus Eisenbacteria bacterium]
MTLLVAAAVPSIARSDDLTVVADVDRSSYSWFGRITVTAEVRYQGEPIPDCDSVRAVSPANPRVRSILTDDGVPPDAVPGDGSYAGYFEIGGDLGEARPPGSYAVEVTAYRDDLSGSGSSPSFSLYTVRRWTGITTGTVNDPYDEYTTFHVTENEPGGGWHHVIGDLGLIRPYSVSDAWIRIPILPQTNTISNVSVSGDGVSDVAVRDNVIEFACDLTGATVTRVTIGFDAPSDLAATYIDRYHTADIGRRDFRNGYAVWNRYIHTGILGSDHSYLHGPGCVVDLHVTDLGTGEAHTVDCMERVAVHLDDSAHNDGTGTYPSNIKWSGDAVSWLQSGGLESLTFVIPSGGNYGLADKVSVMKRVRFYSDRRMFRHEYVVENIDGVSHDFDFVWGREQWLYGSESGSNRQEDDRGLLPNDAGSYGGEYGFAPEEIDGNWFAAFDETSLYTIGVVLPEGSPEVMPDFAYFLCTPALGNFTGEYPIQPAGSCTDMPNIFFEKRFGLLSPGESIEYAFYQWGGYGIDREELTAHLWLDAVDVSGDPLVVDFTPIGDGVPVTTAIDLWFNNPMDHASTEAAFALTPDVPGGGTWTWSEADRRATFQPAQYLDPQTVYAVELQRDAMDVQGRNLATVASWYFETGTLADAPADDARAVATLLSSAPNPFRVSTSIAFVVPEEGPARVSLYNVDGRLVNTLVDGRFAAGRHVARWSGKNANGRRLGAGIYFCRLETAGRVEVRKIVIGR